GSMKKTIYCLTGAAGYLGQAIIHELQIDNADIRALVVPGQTLNNQGVTTFVGDILKPATLVPFFMHDQEKESLIVIHTAAIISIASRMNKLVYKTNVLGSQNMLDMARAFKVKRFVYVSSVHALSEPKKISIVKETSTFNPKKVVGCYAKTKAEASKRVMESASEDFEVLTLHPSGIIGPGAYRPNDNMLKMMIDYINGDLNVGTHGGYDFVDVRDVAHAIKIAALYGENRQSYILSGNYYQVREIFDIIANITGRKKPRIYLHPAFIRIFAWMSELHYKIKKKTPVFTGYSMYTLQSKARFSHELASKVLDFHPRPLIDTLTDLIGELRSNQVLGFSRKIIARGKRRNL
ncbi:MAG: NAD-dependent epimerase/dehydratase family protein, partial [Bacilli bacterium]